MSYLEDRWKRKNKLLPPLPTKKERKPLARVSKKKAAADKAAKEERGGEKTDLAKWFENKMLLSMRDCENCGLSLRRYNQTDWHGSQHHVLDKSLFPSVATNPINHLVIGKWCCHGQWHTSWENAAKMKIFPKAITIIEKLYPLLSQEEKRKLPDIIMQEIDPLKTL